MRLIRHLQHGFGLTIPRLLRPLFRRRRELLTALQGVPLRSAASYRRTPSAAHRRDTLYRGIETSRGGGDLSAIFQGVMTQVTRHFQIRLQHAAKPRVHGEWRPSIVSVDGRTFSRTAPLRFLGWLCQRFGSSSVGARVPVPVKRDLIAQWAFDTRPLLLRRGRARSPSPLS